MMGYSKNFWALTLGVFLFMTSFNLIIPEMNAFITELDGESYKGLIIGLFTLTAGLSRPFSGKLSDVVGRKITMYIGTLVCIVVTLLYPLSTSVIFFLMLRLMHGFSTGFLPTGATALITDLLPENKRGQGMGVFGTGIALGTGVGQVFGSPIAQTFSINGLFIASSGIAIVALLIVHSVKETLPNPQPFTFSILRVRKEDILEKQVIPAAIVMFLTAMSTGLVLVLTQELSIFLSIENKGLYFVFYSISTILVRLVAGNLSDKIGRKETLIIGCVILALSMGLTGFAESVKMYSIASFTFGLGAGIISPALFAWMADLAPSHRRGVGSATIFIALEFGILFGSVVTLWMYQNTLETLRYSFVFGAVMALLALVYLIVLMVKERRKGLQ